MRLSARLCAIVHSTARIKCFWTVRCPIAYPCTRLIHVPYTSSVHDCLQSHRLDIENLKRATKTADKRSLPRGLLFHNDVLQARSLLTEKGWLFEELEVVDAKQETRWGLVFAKPTSLLILQRRGWLTQFDATHKLNKWSHNMFLFLVRDEYNVWIPAAHLVVERENGEIIAEGLKHIKRWCNGILNYPLLGA